MNQQAISLRKARAIYTLTRVIGGLILVLTLVYCAHEWSAVRSRELRQMDSLSVVMSRALDAFFADKQADLEFLAQSLARVPAGPGRLAQVQRQLREFKRDRDDTILVALVDPGGQFQASSKTEDLHDLPNIADVPSFQEFLREYHEGQTLYLGRPQLGKVSGVWGFSLRHVIHDASGRTVGHLNHVLSVDFLKSLWATAPSFTGSSLTLGVLRDDGYLLGRYPLPEGFALSEVYGRPRGGPLNAYLGSHDHPREGIVSGTNLIGGQSYAHAFRRLERFPVTVFVAQSNRDLVFIWLKEISLPLVFGLLLFVGSALGARTLLRSEERWEQEREQAEEDLRQKEEQQRFLIDRMLAALVVHDGQGAVVRCNAEASRVLGLTLEQMQGRQLVDPAWQFLREDGNPMSLNEYPAARVLLTRQPVNDLIGGIRKPDGQPVTWVYCRADPWFDRDGTISQIVVTFIDITHIKAMDQELRDKEARVRALFENSLDAVLLLSPSGAVHAANPAACSLFRMKEDQIRAAGRGGLVDAEDPSFAAFLGRATATGRAFGAFTCRRGDGSLFKAEASSSVYTDSTGQEFTSMIVRDVTERQNIQAALEAANSQMLRVNEQLMEMAHYDALTHLPNRALLTDRMQQAIAHSVRRNRSVAIAFLDLDGFKDINDQYGHDIGDRFLVELGLHMKAELREGDTLARLGGDEFVAVLTDLGDELDCEPMLRRLLKSAATPVVIEGRVLRVTASVGVTIYPKDGATPEVLLRHADQAMYMAKQAGKNRYHLFDVESDAAVRNRRADLQRVERALRSGEFVLYYQPQVNMRTGDVVGVEALVRWRHPERGLLAPGLFLPLVEDDDIAITLGGHVLELAAQQQIDWRRMGLNLRVGVNIFARQLQDTRFVEHLRELMERFPELDPACLELEVVETSALLDIEEVSRLMRACAELGVHFALDDFGTGYSSLTYLKRLPAELLKIDQSFVRDMLDDHDDLTIVEGVIGLAHAFSRKVIAEGVETVDHARLLLSKGCELGQGYGIARPMPAEELPQWIAIWKARQPWVGASVGQVTPP